MTSSKSSPVFPQHPIRVVSQRTGLKPDLIRAWERRYGAIKPRRTAGRHRFYSDKDIERLLLLRRATSSERSIGQLAQLSDEQLRALIENDRSPEPAHLPALPEQKPANVFDEALNAIAELSSEALAARLDQAALRLGYARALSDWVEPLLAEARERHRLGRLREAHLRFAECELRAFVQGLMRRAPLDAAAPRVVVATLIGDRWELGALLMAAHAIGEGWRAVYLGTEVPAEEIAAARKTTEAVAVMLDLPAPPRYPETRYPETRCPETQHPETQRPEQQNPEPKSHTQGAQLRDLRRRLGSDVPLLVGGPALSDHASSWRSPVLDGEAFAPALSVQNHGELRTLLVQLRARHRSRRSAKDRVDAAQSPLRGPAGEDVPIGHRELPLSADARHHRHLEPSLLTEGGGLRIGSLQSVRRLVHRLNEHPDVQDGREPLFFAGQIKAAALIHEVLHHCMQAFDSDPSHPWSTLAEHRLSQPSTEALVERFARLFPPLSSHNQLADQSSKELETSRWGRLLRRLLVLRRLNDNPALQGARRLFDDRDLRDDPAYDQVCRDLEQALDALSSPEEGSTLLDELLGAQRAAPDDLPRQLQLWLETCPRLTDELADRLWLCLDVLHEERAPRWDDIHRRPLDSEPRLSEPDTVDAPASLVPTERPSLPWMRELVLITKDVLLWLDQLSSAHGKAITTLDQIPDQELERLAALGVTGIWLVGIWKRSPASRRIRRRMGDAEAVASPYAIEDYEVAPELGGRPAKKDLEQRARSRGIRLACDLMPNHTAIDGRWLLEHPERFMQTAERPFPSYTFDGEDLSSDPRVAIFLEDHYSDQSDAAVVFQRVDRSTGETRFIYHGNDGNSLPWNDTAQLDFSREDVRRALIEQIVDLAQEFPILRLGAAMTLIQRHYQRLWFPEPGKGGAVPSRAEHQMTREQFSRFMPRELWQEVLAEVAARAPGTLILAEALWNTETYFAHELGMHRVDSSAFLELLTQGRNDQLIESLRSALAADPSRLEGWAHYLTYPGQIHGQPAGDDRYFAHCTLLATLPGCPIFSHRQFGDPTPEPGRSSEAIRAEDPLSTCAAHQRKIVPLLRDRRLFARAAGLTLFPVHGAEDVIAFVNGMKREMRWVVVNNSPDPKRGVVHCCFNPESPASGSTDPARAATLAEVLHIPTTGPSTLEDLQSDRSFQVHGESAAAHGLSLELEPWETRVLKVAEQAD